MLGVPGVIGVADRVLDRGLTRICYRVGGVGLDGGAFRSEGAQMSRIRTVNHHKVLEVCPVSGFNPKT